MSKFWHSVEIPEFFYYFFREISFVDVEVQNLPFLSHLEALNFDFYEFLHLLVAKIDQM